MTSSNKRGSGADPLYSNHLRGTRFHNNAEHTRELVIERMYARLLGELAMNRFKWDGLPDEVDVRYLELTLYQYALSVFFQDTDGKAGMGTDKYFALQGGASGPLNLMQQPTKYRVVGNQFAGLTLDMDDCVPIWANYMRIPDLDIISIYASRMASFDRTVEINAKAARRTKIVAVSENLRHTMAQINRQIDEGNAVINVGEGMQGLSDMIQALDLGVHPDSVVNMHIAKTRQWNECMGLLGIDNANQDKKERLVASEVDANSDQSNLFRYVNLNARKMACDQINEKYGMNVTVDYNTEVDKQAADMGDALGMGSEDVNADMALEGHGD